MQTYKVAWLLFKNNRKLYRFYMIVMTVTIAIYYNFLAVSFNPYVTAVTDRMESARTASVMCSGILFFVLIFFMLHASHFFYKQRYKEIATYMLMGIKKGKIAKVIILESSIVGGITFAAGCVLGIVFSRLFFMVLGSKSILNAVIPFYFSMKAVIVLMILMGMIWLIIAMSNNRQVRKSKLIQLLNASKKEEVIPRARILRSILGVAGIGWGYYLAIHLKTMGYEGTNYWLPILLLVCIGTYVFYSGFFSLILSAAIANKHFSYRGTRLISLSNTLFRLGTNYRSYAATTILCAAALTALMTSLSINQFDRDRIKLEAPYSLSYLSGDDGLNEKIMEKINASQHKLTGSSKIHFIKAPCSKGNGMRKVEAEYVIVPYSEIEANLEMLKYPHLQQLLEEIKPENEKEASEIKHAKVAFSLEKIKGETCEMAGEHFQLKTVEKIPFLGDMPEVGGMDTFIVTDSRYTQLKQQLQAKEECLNNVNFSDQEHSLELVGQILRLIPNYADCSNSYVAAYQSRYYIFGAFYFLGVLLAIIFMITVFSTIYFKCISEAYSDQKQYSILIKMGIQKEHIRKSIISQLAIAVIIPVLLGISHSWFALGILESFMHMDLAESKVKAVIFVVGCLAVVMVIISQRYMQMVTGKEQQA